MKRILIAFLLTLVPIAGAQVYRITDLGPLSPTAINAWGQVVGDYNGHAYMWTKFAGLRALGTLQGGTFSSAAGINDLGVVTGYADGQGVAVASIQCVDLTQPFIWNPRSGMQGLGTVDFFGPTYACGIPFYGTGINASGEVVGFNEDFATYQYAFVWTQHAGMSLFGGSFSPTRANAVNNVGEIVGQNETLFLHIGHAAAWTNAGSTITDLGTLAGPDLACGSLATAVNDNGQVVGASYVLGDLCNIDSSGEEVFHAVLWTPGGQIRDLGTLAGDIYSIGLKINFFGQVIGSSGSTVTVDVFSGPKGMIHVIGRPFIWSQRSGMRDLNTLISPYSGWILNTAADINVWGQIVGSGTLNGQPHGFLLTPRRWSQ